MALDTISTFSDMLNQYVPESLLKEEIRKRSWVLSNIERDDSWKGGNLIVPFRAARSSSVAFGALTDSTDISSDNYQRGSISTQPELSGSLIFQYKDLIQHDKLSEQNLLKILPDIVDDFSDYMSMVLSFSVMNGTSFAKVTDATNAATGVMIVDRVERFEIGQKCSLDDDDSNPTTVYVTAIAVDTSTVTLSLTRSGAAANLSAYSVAQNAKFYWPGSQASGLTSLRSSLLSSANGGGSTLYGVTKATYPYLQAVNVSGASVTASNLLDSILDAFVTIRQRGKGIPTKVLMSYANFGTVLKLLETSKGAYHNSQSGTKTSVYGWTEVSIFGPAGMLDVVAVHELDNDIIMFLDTRPSVMKLYSNGFIRRIKSPDGLEYTTTRATTGISFICDHYFGGDFVLQRPSYCGIMYSISY